MCVAEELEAVQHFQNRKCESRSKRNKTDHGKKYLVYFIGKGNHFESFKQRDGLLGFPFQIEHTGGYLDNVHMEKHVEYKETRQEAVFLVGLMKIWIKAVTVQIGRKGSFHEIFRMETQQYLLVNFHVMEVKDMEKQSQLPGYKVEC